MHTQLRPIGNAQKELKHVPDAWKRIATRAMIADGSCDVHNVKLKTWSSILSSEQVLRDMSIHDFIFWGYKNPIATLFNNATTWGQMAKIEFSDSVLKAIINLRIYPDKVNSAVAVFRALALHRVLGDYPYPLRETVPRTGTRLEWGYIASPLPEGERVVPGMIITETDSTYKTFEFVTKRWVAYLEQVTQQPVKVHTHVGKTYIILSKMDTVTDVVIITRAQNVYNLLQDPARDTPPMPVLCRICTAPVAGRCNACEIEYCSQACLQKDWPSHKKMCST